MGFLSRLMLVSCFLAPSAVWAQWTPPTPEELSMTSQPEVPGAPAVYLFRQETTHDLAQAATDSNSDALRANFCSTVEPESPITNPQPEMSPKVNFQTLYVRLKVLTPEGERYGAVVIDQPEPYYSVAKVEGRTIQPDGTITPFSGTVDRRMISKTREMLRYRTSFQMPDVKVGSILEYRVTFHYPEYVAPRDIESPPRWFTQQELFVRRADYYYQPHTSIATPEESNHGYSSSSPESVKIIYNRSERSYSIHVTNVLPLPQGDFPLPLHSQSQSAIFHATCFPSMMDFWQTHSKWWSSDVDHFASSSRLKPFAEQIVAPGDTEQQKVNKIYAAVAQLQNLSFGRSETTAADEFTEMKIRNAHDVWTKRQGSAQDLTLLFVGLARAAGLKAYVMAVTDRGQEVFDPKAVREDDLDDYIAIVTVDGKEQFFDPGEPFTPAGQLSWKHSYDGGIRQTESGTATFAQTPGTSYKQNQTLRTARLQLARDGAVTGTVSLSISGAPATKWRQGALNDPAGLNAAIATDLAASLPAGFSVKTTQVTGLTDAASPLIAQLELTGSFPPTSNGEITVPDSLFEARTAPIFTADKRETSVDLHYSSQQQDTVAFTLPAGLKAKSAPADASIPLADTARLVVKHTAQDTSYTTTRTFIQGKAFYGKSDYPALKEFYAKLSAQDAEHVIFAAAP